MDERPMWRRYLRLLGSDPEADVDDELDFHLAMRVEDLMRRGRSEAEARARAEREFGDIEGVRSELHALGRERGRREDRASWWSAVGQDLRFAGRTLRKSPAFTAVVVLTLGLGIGGTTAVFSVVESVLLAPLPYEEPGQLVRLYQHNEGEGNPFREFVTGPHFAEVRDQAASFEDVAALYTYRETGLDLADAGRADRLRVLQVSGDYFRVLRALPSPGRGFRRAEEGDNALVVLSHELWQSRFNGDRSIVGGTIRLSGESHTVTGVAPAGFEDPLVGEVDAWLPLDLEERSANNVHNHFLSAVGRLRNGVGMEQARGEIASLNRALAERWPNTAGDTLIMVPLKEDLVGESRSVLGFLLLAVGLVLLIACVNVANLFLVRSTGRAREFAIRSALGSGGARIARQLLLESLLLAVLGGLLGLALAAVGMDALLALGGEAIPRMETVGLNPKVLGFVGLVSLGSGIAFGVAPAIRFAGTRPGSVLRQQSRSATASRGQGRLRSGLAAAQVALALTLVAGAGVLIASFLRIQQVDLGFQTERVLTFDVSLPTARYDAAARASFQEELAGRLEGIPGVRAAGGVSRLPGTGSYHNWGTHLLTGPRAGSERPSMRAEQRIVSGRYFEALRIPVLAGRVFDAGDDAEAPPRAVVSVAFAREAFPGVPLAAVVGQRVAPTGEEREVIGVVGEVALDARGRSAPTVYQAHRQYAADRNWVLSQVVAADVPLETILPAVRSEVLSLDRELVIYRDAPLTAVVGRGVDRERFALALMAAFAAVALVLAVLGLYGVLAYAVRQRTQEIGIRMALGATTAQIRTLVLSQAAVVVALGLAVGLLGAFALGRWLSSLVFGVSPWDLRVLGATALLLAVAGLCSAWLPARQAARVDPKIAMQEE